MTWREHRIGLIGPLPPPAGGMANQTQQLRELLGSEGATVLLVQTNAAYPWAWVGSVRGLRALVRLLPYLVRLWRCAAKVELFHVMANSGWSWHLFAAPAILTAKLRRVRVVVNYRGGEAETFLQKQRTLVRASLRHADAVVVPSEFLRRVFEGFGVSTLVVPNIVDLARFHPAQRRPVAPFHVVVARNLEALYDVATAIQALATVRASLPEARMTVAGSGPLRGTLEQLAVRLGVEGAVEFTGRLDRDQMAALYRTATAVLNPSLVDNMPNSLLEAMASGVPVVSTCVGGIPFIVEDGVSALLTAPGDHEAMAAALQRLHDDASLTQRLVTAGLAAVKIYAWPNVRSAWLGIYEAANRQAGSAASMA